MSSVVVTLDSFTRIMYPALAEPKKIGNEDHAKFRLRAMWPQEGVYDHPEVGEIDANPDDLLAALSEVCEAEFQYPINSIEDLKAIKEEIGIQFPPNIQDGNTVKKMDEDGRPIRGEFDERFAGYDFINLTTGTQVTEVPAVVDHNEDEIDPKKPYAGCWCRLQLEVSAYYKDRSPIIAIALLAVQYVYDDEALAGGGRPPRPDATKAFGKVKNGTAKTNDAKRMGKPGERSSRPSRNDTVTTERICKSLGDFTIEEMTEDGWTEDELVAEGYAEWVEVEAKKPSRPSRPERKTPPARDEKPSRPSRPERKTPPARDEKPSRPSRPSRPGRDKPETKRPERKAPPAKKLPPKKKPSGPKVVMFDDSEYTYDELKAEKWSDDDIVNSGYGEFDYTDPDA